MTIPVLQNKTVVLGITGGIAAYKTATLVSRLVQGGALVEVVMTESAQQFITPLTFQALTHRRVYTDLFELPAHENIPHIALADSADLLLIAPATANVMAKIANGIADNLLTAIALATPAPILLAPAMETDMWQHPATQANFSRLQEWGTHFVGPAAGRLASGAVGQGRMVEPERIVEATRQLLGRSEDLAGKQVVVTAGGTREALDPVRYLTNRSSGKMGYALAEAARDRGATVTLISAARLPAPYGINLIAVDSASEMLNAVLTHAADAHALVMAAAVADYRPLTIAEQKIKKSDDDLALPLARTDDILLAVATQRRESGWPRCVVGFAAETQDLLQNAAGKLSRKQLDFIIANDVSRSDIGFGADVNQVTILSADEEVELLPVLTKLEVAQEVWARITRKLEPESLAKFGK